MSKRDYYEVLGLSKTANQDEIKKAYKKLAKEYHPDLNPDSKTAEGKFKEVTEAYETLIDEEARARYDHYGHNDPSASAGYGGGGYAGGGGGFGGFSDIFEAVFNGGFGGSQQQRGPRKGADMRTGVSISFEEAATGVTKEVSVVRMENCSACEGSGAKSGTSPKKCSRCGGSGQVRNTQSTPFGQFQTVVSCPQCQGRGSVIETPCRNCGGTGKERKERKLNINIPAGVDTGSNLRMAGEGEAGSLGGPCGDLYITITVKPHKYFRRSGDDVLCDYTIGFAQAALGCDVEVPTLQGDVKLNIPEGTQSGTTFRLRGRGFTRLRGRGQGDQHVTVKIVTPTHLSDEQKTLLREFESAVSKNSDSGDNGKKGFFGKIFN